jgi:uncharacterized protein with FMN-binding domain
VRRAVFAIVAIAVATTVVVGVKQPARQPHPRRTKPLSGHPAAHLPPGAYLVTGPVERTPHGRVQVRISVDGGRLTDVVALQLPVGGRSTEINQSAVPVLRQEALTAQSADIDAVSGATNTSVGYARSLQAALDAAAHGRRG